MPIHIEYDEHHALDLAKKVVRLAIDNLPEPEERAGFACQHQDRTI